MMGFLNVLAAIVALIGGHHGFAILFSVAALVFYLDDRFGNE